MFTYVFFFLFQLIELISKRRTQIFSLFKQQTSSSRLSKTVIQILFVEGSCSFCQQLLIFAVDFSGTTQNFDIQFQFKDSIHIRSFNSEFQYTYSVQFKTSIFSFNTHFQFQLKSFDTQMQFQLTKIFKLFQFHSPAFFSEGGYVVCSLKLVPVLRRRLSSVYICQ